MSARSPSLILRATLGFALVALLAVGGAGAFLYHSLERTVLERADYALLGRLAHFRSLLSADLSLETSTRRVWRGGKEIRLSGREFALLEDMMYNEGIVLTRGQIGQHIWNSQGANASNVVDVYIRYLRRKIDDESKVKLIRTVRGAGYRLSAEE